MNFGKNLKFLMIEAGITQIELAKQIGYTQRAISKWVNNQAEPTETAIKKCAEFFEVSSDFLLGLDDFGVNIADSATAPPAYTKEEQELINNFRELNPMNKKLINQTMNALLSATPAESKKKKYN